MEISPCKPSIKLNKHFSEEREVDDYCSRSKLHKRHARCSKQERVLALARDDRTNTKD